MAVNKAQYAAQSAELITKLLSTTITQPEFKTQWADLNNAYGVSNPELADRQGKFIDESQDLKKGMYDWATGTVNGGPNHDGMYPIKLVTGGTVMWPCIARIIDPLFGSEALAKEYAERAEAALASFLENTDNSAESAAAAKASELAAKASELAAAASAAGVDAVRAEAETARDLAVAAKIGSETARDAAVAAKTGAEGARDAAALSATDAHDSAGAAAGSVGQVLDAAEEATANAQAAASSAADALESKQDAESAATSANAAKGAAEASESAAALSETNARASELAAKASELAAQAEKVAAEAARDAAALSATDLDAAKTAAVNAKVAAEVAQAAAEVARSAVEAIQTDVTASKVAAAASASAAQTAQIETEAARDIATAKATAAQASAEKAEQFAQSAVVNADRAFSYAETANQLKDQAAQYAGQANIWYTNTNDARIEAQTAKAQAEAYRNQAASSATDANTSKTQAANSEAAAQYWAGVIHSAATVTIDASEAAVAAANDAEEAQAIASEARDEAVAAREIAVAAKLAAEAAALEAAETVGFDIADYQPKAAKGQPNGYASLDATGKVPLSQLDTAVLGGLNYQGAWNAATNSPAIPTASTVNKGQYFIVSTSGSTNIDGVTDWQVSDLIMSNGQFWHKLDQTNLILSVNGETGAVEITAAKLGLGNADNTSDANKPVSTATQSALNLKLDIASKANNTDATTGTDDTKYMTAAKTKAAITNATIPQAQVTDLTTALGGKQAISEKGQANGYASLDSGGKVPAAQLDLTWGAISDKPSTYAPSAHNHAIGDITGLQAALDSKLATSGAVLSVSGRTGAVTLAKADVGLSNVDNTADSDKPVSAATFTALTGKLNVSDKAVWSQINTGDYRDVGYVTPSQADFIANYRLSAANFLQRTEKASNADAYAGTDDTKYMTPLKTGTLVSDRIVNSGLFRDGDFAKYDRQTVVRPTISSGVLTLDLSLASVFLVDWSQNITSINVTGRQLGSGDSVSSFMLVLVGKGTNQTVAWNTTLFGFPGGNSPTLVYANGARNYLNCSSFGLSKWDVFFSGAAI